MTVADIAELPTSDAHNRAGKGDFRSADKSYERKIHERPRTPCRVPLKNAAIPRSRCDRASDALNAFRTFSDDNATGRVFSSAAGFAVPRPRSPIHGPFLRDNGHQPCVTRGRAGNGNRYALALQLHSVTRAARARARATEERKQKKKTVIRLPERRSRGRLRIGVANVD